MAQELFGLRQGGGFLLVVTHEGKPVANARLVRSGEVGGSEKDDEAITEGKERDKDSDEHLVKRELALDSGDSVYIEQKYCSMYNLTVVYRLIEVDESSFERGLGVIHSVVKSVGLDYRLKSPLENIVNMTMNQRGLTLSESFEYGLPLQAAQSSDNVEHTIGFELLPDSSEFSAEIRFYLGLGGL